MAKIGSYRIDPEDPEKIEETSRNIPRYDERASDKLQDKIEAGSNQKPQSIHLADVPKGSNVRNYSGGGTRNTQIYVLHRRFYSKDGKLRCEMVALTPLEESRQPYAFTMPVGNARKEFRYVEKKDKVWQKALCNLPGGLKKISTKRSDHAQRVYFPNFGRGILLVAQNNVSFKKLEDRLHGVDEVPQIEDIDETHLTEQEIDDLEVYEDLVANNDEEEATHLSD